MPVYTDYTGRNAGQDSASDQFRRPDIRSTNLSVDQHCLLNLGLANPNWVFCNMLFEVVSDIDAGLVGKAIGKLLERHEALRARFVLVNGEWKQYLDDRVDTIPVERIHALSGEQIGPDYFSGLARRKCADVDISKSPLLRCVIVDGGEKGESRLLLAIHHLLVDGLSVCLLIDEFVRIYSSIERGSVERLPDIGVPFSEWTEKLSRYINEVLVHEEINYWRSVPWWKFKKIPVDFPENVNQNTFSTLEKTSARLTVEETDALFLSLSPKQSVSIVDVLVTAIFEVVTEWIDQRHLMMFVHDSGRNAVPGSAIEPALTTVGWLSFQRLVHLCRDERYTGPIDSLQAVVRQLKGIPSNGMGFKMLKHCARDSSVKAELGNIQEPTVWLNYVGSVEGALESSLLRLSPMMDAVSRQWMHQDNIQKWLLSFAVTVEKGRLVVSLHYSLKLYRTETVESLNSQVVERLRAMLHDDGERPGLRHE